MNPSPSDRLGLRSYMRTHGIDDERFSDDDLDRAIQEAKDWISGRRWSWKVVATNLLQDGYLHA